MNSGASSKLSVGERLIDETKEFVVIAVYLGICFIALAYLKASILRAEGISFAPFGFAVAKALICAKFVVLGTHVPSRRMVKAPAPYMVDVAQVVGVPSFVAHS
jgi:hypothetical protein